MKNFLKAAMVAAFVLSVGTAWAATATVEIDSDDNSTPTPIGTVLYDSASVNTWGTDLTSLDEAYGEAVSLTIHDGASLTIGTTYADDAIASAAIMNIEILGDVILGDASGAGTLNIGVAGGAYDTNVIADNFYLVNGAATLEDHVNLEVNTFVLDYIGTSGSSTFTMLDGSSLVVNGGGDPNFYDFSIGATADDATFAMDDSELFVDGIVGIGNFGAGGAGTATFEFTENSDVEFTGGMELAEGGVVENTGGALATIKVGEYDATNPIIGNVVMYGGALINGGTNGIEIIDAAQTASDGALSEFFVVGENNIIQGDLSLGAGGVGSYKTYMDMVVGMDQEGNLVETDLQIGHAGGPSASLTVRNYYQATGEVFTGLSGDNAADAVITVLGKYFGIDGGLFGVSAEFANPDADDIYVDGRTWKWWDENNFAIIVGTGDEGLGTAQFFQGRTGTTVQQFLIGKNAAIDVTEGDSVYYDLDVIVDKEGDVLFGAEEKLIYLINDSAITITDKGSVKFDPELLKDVNGDLALLSPGDTYGLIDATGSSFSDAIIAPEFSFSGMFGDFSVGYNTAGDVYGITGYANATGVVFDGTYADADLGWEAIRGTYGDRVQLGLSDMAYRAALLSDGPDLEVLDLKTSPTVAEFDSYVLSLNNLFDIASGRAARSTVALYNGSAAFGVNQVSASTALSHIQVGLRRSDDIRKINSLVRNSVSGNDAYAASIMNQCYTNRFWAGGFGLWEDADARRDFDGYKYKSAGVAVGYDRMFGPNVIVGGSFAATFGDYEDKSALAHDSDIDSYSFNLYATYTHNSGFFGTVFGGYTYSDNDIRELRLSGLNNRLWNTANYHTNSWTLGGKIGYDVKPTERFSITPSVGLTWINARSSAHNEYLDDVIAVRYGRMKTNQTYLPVELGFGYDAFVSGSSKLNLALNFGYAYNFNNDHIKGSISMPWIANDTPYSAVSREPGHHTFTVGAGLRYTMGRFDIGAKYDYARKARMDSHRLYGTLGISF